MQERRRIIHCKVVLLCVCVCGVCVWSVNGRSFSWGLPLVDDIVDEIYNVQFLIVPNTRTI